MKSSHVIVSFCSAAALFACGSPSGHDDSRSETRAIGTDLPDTGGDARVKLYWIVDGTLFRGVCEGRDTVIPLCSDNLQSMTYDLFRTKLDGGLSQTIRDLSAEAQRIRAAISIVEAELHATVAEIDRIEQQSGGLSAQLKELRLKMSRFEAAVNAYKEQLALIDAALQKAASDPDLLGQRLIVIDALTRYQAQLSNIGAKIPVLLDQIHAIQSQVATLHAKLQSLTTRLSNLRDEMVQVETRLRLAYDDFSVYESTLRKLGDGIVYTVLSDNVIAQRERQFVRRFEKIFQAGT